MVSRILHVGILVNLDTLKPHCNKVAFDTKITSLYPKILYKRTIFEPLYLLPRPFFIPFVIADNTLYLCSLYQALSVVYLVHVFDRTFPYYSWNLHFQRLQAFCGWFCSSSVSMNRYEGKTTLQPQLKCTCVFIIARKIICCIHALKSMIQRCLLSGFWRFFFFSCCPINVYIVFLNIL